MTKEKLGPVDLQCEYIKNPIGIDRNDPRFSWKIAGTCNVGVKQNAYRLQVFTEKDTSQNPFFDTGKVAGSLPNGIRCTGLALESFSVYYWRVAVWLTLEAGQEQFTGFSDFACFETTALDRQLLKAKWITHPNPTSYYEGRWESGTAHTKNELEESLHYHAVYCVKKMHIVKPHNIKRARALVCGLGLYSFYINAQKVGEDLLSPAQTDFSVRAFYTVYDVDGVLTKQSSNTICLVIGNGRYIKLYGFSKPRGFMQLFIEYQDGTNEVICSDESWTVGEGPITQNSLFNGEHYDGRRTFPYGSEILVNPDHAQIVPGPELQSSILPPVIIDKKLHPIDFWKTETGYVFDFGQNFSGFVELNISLPSGTEIVLRYAELVHEDGSLNTASNRGARAEDRLVSGGDQVSWHPSFTYHGFRYVELRGFPEEPTKEMLTGLFIHTSVDRASFFKCSSNIINSIHQNVLWGQLSNMCGIPTDSPQRDERHGWLADAMLSVEECLLNFMPIRFYEKFIGDIVDTQQPDGSISDTAPRFWMNKPADPAWGSALITIAWELYRYTGDKYVIEKYYSSFMRYINFLLQHISASTGLIEDLGTFGDWCAPGMIVPKKTDLSFTSTWYLQHDLEIMGKIAALLNHNEDVQKFEEQYAHTVESINKTFLRNGRYESMKLSPWDFPDQTAQAMALSSTVVPQSMRSSVEDALVYSIKFATGEHVGTGIHGTRYLFPALTQSGHEELAYRIAVQRTYPGWGYMIAEGATTLWERWEKIEVEGMNSHNHIMFGSIDSWFYHTIVGMYPKDTGWQQVGLCPGRLSEISYAQAACSTPFGEVSMLWERRRNEEVEELFIKISLPGGSGGELDLKQACEKIITRNNNVIPKEWIIKDKNSDKIVLRAKHIEHPIPLWSGNHQFVFTHIT